MWKIRVYVTQLQNSCHLFHMVDIEFRGQSKLLYILQRRDVYIYIHACSVYVAIEECYHSKKYDNNEHTRNRNSKGLSSKSKEC